MLQTRAARWTLPATTFALWALAAASVVFWGLRLSAPGGGAPSAAVATGAAPPADPVALLRLLGASPSAASPAIASAPPLASRFVLTGVVSGSRRESGAAVLSVDGKPARPYRVGALIDQGLVLQAVRGRQVLIGPAGGPATVTLELPAPRQ